MTLNQECSNHAALCFCMSVSQELYHARFQITLKAGHHRPASETPFKWRFAGGPMMAQH